MYIAITSESLLEVEKSILPQAIKGDYQAICTLLLILSEALLRNIPLSPALAAFLADALREISNGGDPKVAFNIKRKRGEKDTRAAVEKNVMLAFKVAVLRKNIKGLSVEKAIVQIANEEYASEDTVKAAWRDYRGSVELTACGAFLTFAKVKKKKE